jgi:signal peptidase I
MAQSSDPLSTPRRSSAARNRREQAGSGRQPQRSPQKRSALSLAVEIVLIVVAAFAIAMVVQFFIVKPFTIHQVSMQPTLLEGDRVLINRLTYHFRDPERGDVVVFDSPVDAREDLVKRIVAVPGDMVAIQSGVLYVNGKAQEEPYITESPFDGADMPEVRLGSDEVFVMGDNRNNSGDSRLFGPIGVDSIIGDAFAIYWPIGRWNGL